MVDPELINWFETLPEAQRQQLVTDVAQAAREGDVLEVWYEDAETGERELYQVIGLYADGSPAKIIPAKLWFGWDDDRS